MECHLKFFVEKNLDGFWELNAVVKRTVVVCVTMTRVGCRGKKVVDV